MAYTLSGISVLPVFYWPNPIKCWAVVGTAPQSGKETPHAMSDRLDYTVATSYLWSCCYVRVGHKNILVCAIAMT